MENVKTVDETTEVNKDLLNSEKNEKEKNFDTNKSAQKPTSLKFQHFESFTKKALENNGSQTNKNESSKENKVYDINIIKHKTYLMNFSSFKSFPKIQPRYSNNYNNDNIKDNRQRSLNTWSNVRAKLSNINKDKNRSKISMEIRNRNMGKKKLNDKNIFKSSFKIIKIKSKTPNQTYANKNNESTDTNYTINKSRNQKNMLLPKTQSNSQNVEGYLGRKDLNGVPYTFEPIMLFHNDYSNKSEKKRHEIVMDEFIRLRQYIERQPENKLKFIKEFLKKYYVEYEKYTDDQLSSLCDFICYHDKIAISSILKPYLNIKDMISELIENIDKTNEMLGIKKNNKENEIKEEEETFDVEGGIDKYIKESNDNCLITVKKFENEEQQNLNRYSSPNLRENEKNNYKAICENKRKENVIKYLNKKYNNNRYESNIADEEEALKEVKIKLRDLSHQKKLFVPDKNYSYRYDLIINDMNKEMVVLKNNLEKRLFFQKFPKRNIYKSTKNNNLNMTSKNIIMFSQYNKRPKDLNKIEEIINKVIADNKMNTFSNGYINLPKDDSSQNNRANTQTNSLGKYSMDEIKKRLYYNPMKIKFDLKEVRRNNKLTEYYALKLAKHNKFLKDLNDNSYFKDKNTENKENNENKENKESEKKILNYV